MRVVVVLAMAALFALMVALVGGGTWFAVLVIALASTGIVLLARDWWRDRARGKRQPAAVPTQAGEAGRDGGAAGADELSPDISTHPDGPSSDARADSSD